jgi:hypothetical protein
MYFETRDREFLRIVAGKIKGLAGALGKGITEEELRDNVCANLRFLLVDDSYQRAWNLLSENTRRIFIPAIDLHKMVGNTSLKHCAFMQCAGAQHGSWQAQNVQFFTRARSDEESRDEYERTKDISPITNFTIQKFVASPCIFIQGHWITRQMIIQYVAYRLGGVHFDPKAAESDKYENAFRKLDMLRKGMSTIKLLGHTPAYIELLSIGQDLVNSNDCEELVRREVSLV